MQLLLPFNEFIIIQHVPNNKDMEVVRMHQQRFQGVTELCLDMLSFARSNLAHCAANNELLRECVVVGCSNSCQPDFTTHARHALWKCWSGRDTNVFAVVPKPRIRLYQLGSGEGTRRGEQVKGRVKLSPLPWLSPTLQRRVACVTCSVWVCAYRADSFGYLHSVMGESR